MKYSIKLITLDQLPHTELFLTSMEADEFITKWWGTLNKHKNDSDSAANSITKTYHEIGQLYIKSNYAYVNRKSNAFIGKMTRDEWEKHRIIILPPPSHFTRDSVNHLSSLIKNDIKFHKFYSDDYINRVFDTNDFQMKKDLILDLDKLKNIQFKNGSIKKKLQSGRSLIRRVILSPKSTGLRFQIVSHTSLHPTQVILPVTFRDYLRINPKTLIDPVNSTFHEIQKSMIPIRSDMTLIMKRDPVINLGSIALITEVAFSENSILYIPTYIMNNMHADVDGDAMIIYVIHGIISNVESNQFINPKFNMLMPNNKLRLNFSQFHYLYMHNRSLPASHQYYNLYEIIKKKYCDECKADPVYMNQFLNLQKYIPDLDESFIEPTKKILEEFLYCIIQKYDNMAAYNFMIELNRAVVELSENHVNDYFDPKLLLHYGLDDTLSSKNLARICFSGACGTPQHLLTIIQRKMEIDNNLNLKSYTPSINYSMDFKKIVSIIQNMSKASDEVSKNGYNSYKNSIDWSTIDIVDGQLYWNGFNESNDPPKYGRWSLGHIENFTLSPFNISPMIVYLFFLDTLKNEA